MAEPKESLHIRRILVALDASQHSLAALEMAASMAELLHAELMGVFVEDINLLRVAQLPFVQEVRYPMARLREIDEARMTQQLRALAAQAERELSEIAAKRHVRWSFRIARGSVAAELLAASLQAEADMLALGRFGRSLVPQTLLGSTARVAVKQAKGPVLLMRAGVDLEQPLLLIYDGTAAARRALVLASLLVGKNGRLRMLIWAEDDDTAQQYRQDVDTQLHEHDETIEVSYRRLHPQAERLVEVVEQSDFGLLLVGGTDSQLPPALVESLLEELDIPIMIVR